MCELQGRHFEKRRNRRDWTETPPTTHTPNFQASVEPFLEKGTHSLFLHSFCNN